VRGVLAAGELTGVGGADLALLGGALAGTAAAAVAAGRRPPVVHPGVDARRARLAAFAAAMHGAHPVRDGWTGWLSADTLVCRCEEVSAATIDDAVTELGASDARTAKLLTRAGMGWCQGRMCGEAVARLVASRTGGRLDPYADLLGGGARPVAVPVALGVLAGDPEPTGITTGPPDLLEAEDPAPTPPGGTA
jgi:hypothetical protein